MNTRYVAPSILMASLIAVGSPAAMASDELAGALFGAGAGAIVGHAVGGKDAAVVGGFLGALVGATVADDDHRTVVVHPRPYAGYGPAPVRYYAPPPSWSGPRHAHSQWRHDRDGRDDGYRKRDRDGWRDRDHDRNRWNQDRGPRSDGPRDYRNW